MLSSHLLRIYLSHARLRLPPAVLVSFSRSLFQGCSFVAQFFGDARRNFTRCRATTRNYTVVVYRRNPFRISTKFHLLRYVTTHDTTRHDTLSSQCILAKEKPASVSLSVTFQWRIQNFEKKGETIYQLRPHLSQCAQRNICLLRGKAIF